MNKKRFTRHKSLDGDCTIYDGLKDFQFPSLPLGVSEIFCDKLNELFDEKEKWESAPVILSNENVKLVDKFFKEPQFKNYVFAVIDGKIKDVEKELEDYHPENENAMLVGRLWALEELKEKLMGNGEWLEIELE